MTEMRQIYTIKRLLIILLLAIGMSLTVLAKENKTYQQNSSKYNKALKYEEASNYKEAISIYAKLAKSGNLTSELLYHIAICQLNLTKADLAVETLMKSHELLDSTDLSSDLSIDILLTMGKCYQLAFKPLDAIKTYNELLQIIKESDGELKKEIENEIKICKNALIFMDNPVEIIIKNLGDKVNTKANDHTPVVTINEEQLYYTSRQKRDNERSLEDGDNPEKIYHSTLSSNQWSKNYLLEVFFKNFENESALSLSADGLDLFLFRNDEEGQSLYQTVYDGTKWTKPFKLPPPINSIANETHACLSPDKSTLFFTSDREGGLGGKDIYLVRRMANGKWGSLTNLGPNINSNEDEETPIFHYDGKTLYFASEGHNSMGRMDVFYSQMRPDSTWSEPINMGYPINSPDDDFSFAPSLSKDHAYYTSTRQGDNYGGADIYRVEFKEFLHGNLAVIEGKIDSKDSSSLQNGNIRILVTKKDQDKPVGNYHPNKNGEFTMFLETGQEYQVIQKVAGKSDIITEIYVTKDEAYKPSSRFTTFDSLKVEPPLWAATHTSKTANTVIALTNDSLKNISNTALFTSKKSVTNINLLESEKNMYTIQLLALKRRSKPFKNYFSNLKEYKIRTHRCIDGYTRYIVGNFSSKEEANQVLTSIKATGNYQDAFIRNTYPDGSTHKH